MAVSGGCGGGEEVRGGSAKGGRALGDLRTVSCGLLSCGLSSRCSAWSAGWGRTLPWPRPFHWTAARGIVGIRRSRRLRHLRCRRCARLPRLGARLPRLDALCTHRRLVHLLKKQLWPYMGNTYCISVNTMHSPCIQPSFKYIQIQYTLYLVYQEQIH